MRIERLLEHEINGELHSRIISLRNECFPVFESDRSYYKQLPHFRYLTFDQEQLVGHVGIDHRMISFGNVPYSVFGIIDLCVAEQSRGHGIGKSLLATVEATAREAGIDAMVLLADDPRIYEQCGFVCLRRVCHWLRIDDHANFGVGMEEIENALMIKSLNSQMEPYGPIDFLGYMF